MFFTQNIGYSMFKVLVFSLIKFFENTLSLHDKIMKEPVRKQAVRKYATAVQARRILHISEVFT